MEIKIFGRDVFIKIEVIILSVIILCILVGVSSYRVGIAQNSGIIINTENSEPVEKSGISDKEAMKKESTNITSLITPVVEEKIRVYVVGCVNKPGLVTIKKGEVIYDAVQAAGGANSLADINNINMAYVLSENCMLKIYAKPSHLVVNNKIQTGKSSNTKKAKETLSILKKPDNKKEAYDIIKDSGGTKVDEIKLNSPQELNQNKININTASAAELDKLSGIGMSTAADIISFRTRNGGFKKIEDIMKVPGIKEKTFSKIKDQIIV